MGCNPILDCRRHSVDADASCKRALTVADVGGEGGVPLPLSVPLQGLFAYT